MWLADFLPKESSMCNTRIMTYGYNTQLLNNTVDMKMMDYRREFIQALEIARQSTKVCRSKSLKISPDFIYKWGQRCDFSWRKLTSEIRNNQGQYSLSATVWEVC